MFWVSQNTRPNTTTVNDKLSVTVHKYLRPWLNLSQMSFNTSRLQAELKTLNLKLQ